MNIGARIQLARLACYWTQEELGKKLGLKTGQTVGKWERGSRQPSIANLRQLCEVLDVSADWLLEIDHPHGR